jgi:hypothetical protein
LAEKAGSAAALVTGAETLGTVGEKLPLFNCGATGTVGRTAALPGKSVFVGSKFEDEGV